MRQQRRAGRETQYFADKPATGRRPREIAARLRGRPFRFRTDAGVFSPGRIDKGTELLVESMELPPRGEVLDWGCGYGVVGIVAAAVAPECRVTLGEINERAVELTRENVRLNNVRNVYVAAGDMFAWLPDLTFDVILTNPPIRAGNRVVFRLIEECAESLRPGGSFWLVGRRKQGIATLQRRMEGCFGRVEQAAVKAGYRVLRATEPRYTRP
ncbi:MAG: class I SAM-dependent methyltransferase [Armatimonadota bacterium]